MIIERIQEKFAKKYSTDAPIDLLTVVEAATYLGIRPWTLRHWISDRKIDIVKYGNGLVRRRAAENVAGKRPRFEHTKRMD